MARRPGTESEGSSQNIERSIDEPENGANIVGDEREEHEDGDDHGEEQDEQRNDDDEDEDEDEDDDDDGSSRGAKRARVNDDGEGVNVRKERSSARRPAHPAVLQRDADGYVPGSIVRVKLHQFLTYDDVEFRPGPYLNMVLGPNGTGKSSIACALCLGLNWPPNVLGRAPKLGAFVKQGYNDAFIEIELKGPIGKPNLVIRRLLTKQMDRSQDFTLNGEKTPGKQISEHVEGLGIQVNNLCSFLPQDKVAEFAQMSPQQLLRATQKAAGNENLITWHDYLISAGKELNQLTATINTERIELATLEQRNATLEKEVQAYQQRREIERKMELLELILPFKEYLDARTEYDRLKKIREGLHKRVTVLRQRNQPAIDFKEELEKQYKEFAEERERCKKSARDRFKAMNDLWNSNNDLQTQSDAVSDSLVNLKRQERQRKERIQNLTCDIHKLEDDIAHPPHTEDTDVIEADRRANAKALEKAENDKHELEETIKPYVDESTRQSVRIERATHDLTLLDNAAHRKLQALEYWDKNTAEVVRWLRNNKHRFKMEVFEPACLSMDVRDARYANAVEAAFSAMQMKTFVCQCWEDYKLFTRLIVDSTEGMGRKIRVAIFFREYQPDLFNPPPMSAEELHEQGFDAYAIDCVTYPEGMLWFLQDQVQLHRFAIALSPNRVDVTRAMKVVSRSLPGGKGGAGNFTAGRLLSQVTRSRYGQRKPFNATRDIRQARSFSHPPVDQEKKRDLESTITQAKQLQAEAEAEIARIGHKIADASKVIDDISKQRSEIEARRKACNEVKRKLQTFQIKLTQKQQALKKEEKAPSVDEARHKLRQKGFEIAKQRAGIVKRLHVVIRGVIDDHVKATRVGLQYLQIGANKEALEELVRTHNADLNAAIQDYTAIDQEFVDMKNITKEKLRLSKEKLEEIDDELRQTFEEMTECGTVSERDSEDIKQELGDLRAQLELNLASNAGVIEQYERRKRDIDRLRAKVDDREAIQAKTERKIKKTKDRWLPALQELVTNIGEKFSAAFDRVNCAGEIKIAEHPDDYAAWAIDILVKFRDSEDLQLLTGQRQSGGERALTTIMYLMSLTELARAPFSLVDEINQGMDARYERAVHNSLVEVTCRVDSGQYFLITPKLLTDLEYHARMKVLCVNNGEWLPDEPLSGNMMRMIEVYVARRARTQ